MERTCYGKGEPRRQDIGEVSSASPHSEIEEEEEVTSHQEEDRPPLSHQQREEVTSYQEEERRIPVAGKD